MTRTIKTKSRITSGKDKYVVLVTCANAAEGSRIAQAVVEQRLAACVNILQTLVKSVYRWKGNVESADETLLLMKTSGARLAELERAVRGLHSYEVPEFIALPIAAGSQAYLAWLAENVAGARQPAGAGRKGVRWNKK